MASGGARNSDLRERVVFRVRRGRKRCAFTGARSGFDLRDLRARAFVSIRYGRVAPTRPQCDQRGRRHACMGRASPDRSFERIRRRVCNLPGGAPGQRLPFLCRCVGWRSAGRRRYALRRRLPRVCDSERLTHRCHGRHAFARRSPFGKLRALARRRCGLSFGRRRCARQCANARSDAQTVRDRQCEGPRADAPRSRTYAGQHRAARERSLLDQWRYAAA